MSVVRVMMAMLEAVRRPGLLAAGKQRKRARYLRRGLQYPTDQHPPVSKRSIDLSERTLTITDTDPMAVLGANDQNLRIIRDLFPKLNIIARGDTVKVIGGDEIVEVFVDRFEQLVAHVAKYNELPRKVLEDIMGNG